MKKTLFVIVLAVFSAVTSFADEGFAYGFWFHSPKNVINTSVGGLALGVPVINFKDLSGTSLAICANASERTTGFQFSLIGFNYAQSLEGVQLSFVNIQDGQHGDYAVQLGGYNQATDNGVQIGMINNARNNATFQFGLININKNGWLPVMIFVNFSKGMFD